MKINSLKINGFGKLHNKEIELSDGINIIFGENESGKSSTLKFISSMLYGACKNKNGKEISDIERFKPWKTEEFSGKIEYTLDNNEKYEVYREFKKRNAIIYNSNKEDISKDFRMDKTKGIQFFLEQTGIDEDTFYNTAITEQEGVKLSRSSQNSIVQKISNLISSGDDNISFKKSLDQINKKQNEEVGTDRTSQRPINIIETRMRKLYDQKKSLEEYKENIYDTSLQIQQLTLEQKDEELKKEFLQEVKIKLDNNRLKSAEINFNKNLENNYSKKIDELNKKIVTDDAEKSIEQVHNKNYYVFIIVLLITFLILMVLSPYKVVNCIILLPIFYILYRINIEKIKLKQKIKNRESDKEKIINEIEILKQNQEEQKDLAEEKEQKFSNEIEKEKKIIIEKYIKFLDLGFIEENLNKSYDEILKEIDNKEQRINTIKFKLHTVENTAKEISDKLEDIAKIEEDIEDAEKEREELLSLNNSYNIAKECLQRAYNKVKENISPRFTQNLCDIISKISNDRYKNVVFSDTDGLTVEIDNGSYVPASRLSVGTVDQMYISLRLSALNEISNETLPIILDEAFAYFDNERLENMLKYLDMNFKNNQIIIFTCSKREKEVLDRLDINYKFLSI